MTERVENTQNPFALASGERLLDVNWGGGTYNLAKDGKKWKIVSLSFSNRFVWEGLRFNTLAIAKEWCKKYLATISKG